MKDFSSLGVQLARRFQGDRIRIEKIEGDEIIVKDYDVKASKMKKEADTDTGNECLYLQLEVQGDDRVLWGNYKFLINQIKQVSKDDLPFRARIVNDHGYVFK